MSYSQDQEGRLCSGPTIREVRCTYEETRLSQQTSSKEENITYTCYHGSEPIQPTISPAPVFSISCRWRRRGITHGLTVVRWRHESSSRERKNNLAYCQKSKATDRLHSALSKYDPLSLISRTDIISRWSRVEAHTLSAMCTRHTR